MSRWAKMKTVLKNGATLIVLSVAILALTPIVRFDAWLEKRERRKHAKKYFSHRAH